MLIKLHTKYYIFSIRWHTCCMFHDSRPSRYSDTTLDHGTSCSIHQLLTYLCIIGRVINIHRIAWLVVLPVREHRVTRLHVVPNTRSRLVYTCIGATINWNKDSQLATHSSWLYVSGEVQYEYLGGLGRFGGVLTPLINHVGSTLHLAVFHCRERVQSNAAYKTQ